MSSSTNANPQDDRLQNLKEVPIQKLLDYLRALRKLVGTKPAITPVFLVIRQTGEIHEESFDSQDWSVTFGLKKSIRVSYCRKQFLHSFDLHVEEYDLGNFPYRVFVRPDQPLPELPNDGPRRKKKKSKDRHCNRR